MGGDEDEPLSWLEEAAEAPAQPRDAAVREGPPTREDPDEGLDPVVALEGVRLDEEGVYRTVGPVQGPLREPIGVSHRFLFYNVPVAEAIRQLMRGQGRALKRAGQVIWSEPGPDGAAWAATPIPIAESSSTYSDVSASLPEALGRAGREVKAAGALDRRLDVVLESETALVESFTLLLKALCWRLVPIEGEPISATDQELAYLSKLLAQPGVNFIYRYAVGAEVGVDLFTLGDKDFPDNAPSLHLRKADFDAHRNAVASLLLDAKNRGGRGLLGLLTSRSTNPLLALEPEAAADQALAGDEAAAAVIEAARRVLGEEGRRLDIHVAKAREQREVCRQIVGRDLKGACLAMGRSAARLDPLPTMLRGHVRRLHEKKDVAKFLGNFDRGIARDALPVLKDIFETTLTVLNIGLGYRAGQSRNIGDASIAALTRLNNVAFALMEYWKDLPLQDTARPAQVDVLRSVYREEERRNDALDLALHGMAREDLAGKSLGTVVSLHYAPFREALGVSYGFVYRRLVGVERKGVETPAAPPPPREPEPAAAEAPVEAAAAEAAPSAPSAPPEAPPPTAAHAPAAPPEVAPPPVAAEPAEAAAPREEAAPEAPVAAAAMAPAPEDGGEPLPPPPLEPAPEPVLTPPPSIEEEPEPREEAAPAEALAVPGRGEDAGLAPHEAEAPPLDLPPSLGSLPSLEPPAVVEAPPSGETPAPLEVPAALEPPPPIEAPPAPPEAPPEEPLPPPEPEARAEREVPPHSPAEGPPSAPEPAPAPEASPVAAPAVAPPAAPPPAAPPPPAEPSEGLATEVAPAAPPVEPLGAPLASKGRADIEALFAGAIRSHPDLAPAPGVGMGHRLPSILETLGVAKASPPVSVPAVAPAAPPAKTVSPEEVLDLAKTAYWRAIDILEPDVPEEVLKEIGDQLVAEVRRILEKR